MRTLKWSRKIAIALGSFGSIAIGMLIGLYLVRLILWNFASMLSSILFVEFPVIDLIIATIITILSIACLTYLFINKRLTNTFVSMMTVPARLNIAQRYLVLLITGFLAGMMIYSLMYMTILLLS